MQLTHRSLRVDILTIFMLLITLSSILIISFTHYRMSRSIAALSLVEIEREGEILIERINELIDDAEDAVREATSHIVAPDSFSFQKDELFSYLLEVAVTQPHLFGIYMGRPDGSLLEVVNLVAASQTKFVFNPSKPLPEGSAYALHSIDRTQIPPVDVWRYKNENLQDLAKESSVDPTYNPTVRPWYLGAIKSKGEIFWTPIYNYDPTNEPDITVSRAVFDAKETVIAVVGVDLSLSLLSRYIESQKVGKTGGAFVLDASGAVILPQDLTRKKIGKELVEYAFQESKKENKQDFRFEREDVEYLVSVQQFPVTGAYDWVTLTLAPLDDFLGALLKTQRDVALISLGILIAASLLVIFFSKRISVPIVLLAEETDKIRKLDFKSERRVHSNIREIRLMDESIAALRVAIHSFGRYIPKEIVKQLVDKGQEIAIGGEKKEITVFFSDIEGFTSIAESLETEKLMALLTEYFDSLSKILMKNQGNIDKFIGDGIMALWGAPQELSSHAQNGCQAALECQRFLVSFNQKLTSQGLPPLPTRIGIDSGEAIVGNVGTAERMNYTAMGNIVNTASRLQGVNKIYHTRILISERTKRRIGSNFLVRPLDIAELKGKKEKTLIYELMDRSAAGQEELASLFETAFKAFQQDPSGAKKLFLQINQKFPEDFPTRFYLDRTK